MKKSILALAVIGAFAGAASAQTNVTLYGIADAGIGAADAGHDGASNVTHVFSGVHSTSRIGVRGSEDLNNGLKATFNLEAGVAIDTGGNDSNFWSRRAVVGLAGGFGEVRLGRDYTPGYTAMGSTDVMGYGLFGNWLTYVGNGGITQRASNGLHYTSPNWGGLTLRAMYAAGEEGGPGEYALNPNGTTRVIRAAEGHNDMYGLSLVYGNGPLTLQGYYQVREYDNLFDSTNDIEEYGVGAQYRFGVFRVALNYGMAKTERTGTTDYDHDALGLGLGVKVGAGEILFNYIRQEVDNGRTDKVDSYGLAYVHPLSKRTNLYASYGQLKNKSDNTDFVLRASGVTVGDRVDGSDPKAFAIGLRHSF